MFEGHGFLASRITDIAAEAGVAAGSFYTYFASKEEAFSAVIEQLNEEMLHPRLQAVADRDDPVAVIEAAHRAYLTAYRRNAKLMGLMEHVSQIDEQFRSVRLRRTRAFVERNARAISRLQEQGLADPSLDPRLAAQALSAMVSRMAYQRYVQGSSNASGEALVAVLTRLWVNALGIPQTGQAASPPHTEPSPTSRSQR